MIVNVNSLVAKPLNKHMLTVHINDLSAAYSELILHMDIHWLSHGDPVTRIWKVFKEVKAYIYSNGFVAIFA